MNVSWMRCSPDLLKYVRRLEAELETLQSIIANKNKFMVEEWKAVMSADKPLGYANVGFASILEARG